MESVSSTAEAKRPAALPIIAFGLIGILLLCLFHFQGQAENMPGARGSIFLWITGHWRAASADFSHAWFMPLFSIFLVWKNRKEIVAAVSAPSRVGLCLIIFFLVMHWAAIRGQQPRISLAAFVGLLWAIPYYIAGRRVAALILFPCGYLLLCFTSYFLTNIAFPLRIIASALSTGLLNGLGIETFRNGTIVYSSAGGGFQFNVAAPCSGLRSLFVVTAIAAPYAYYTQKTLAKKWTLFLSSLPIAAAANVVRIVSIALIAKFFGLASAMMIHDKYAGYVVLGAAILFMCSFGSLLNHNWKELFWKWIKPEQKPVS